MKKYLIIIGITTVSFALIACGRKNKEETPQETVPPQVSVEETIEEQPTGEIQTGEGLTGETVGKVLLMDFEQYVQNNPEVTAQEMADHILTNPVIQFSGSTMPVEQGLLTGFGNAEITGFKEGVMFAPMIGSIPFVGYIFTLEEGTEPDTFLQLLTDNADPRWNICTEAEETITGKAENMIFFVMSPAQFE